MDSPFPALELRALHQWVLAAWIAAWAIGTLVALVADRPRFGVIVCATAMVGMFPIFLFGLWWIGSGHAGAR